MCFFHQPRLAARPARPERRDDRAYALHGLSPDEFQQLIASGDRPAILRAVSVVIRAIAAREIDPRRAGRILFGLQSVLSRHP